MLVSRLSITDFLSQQAIAHPQHGVVVFHDIDNKKIETLSYQELDEQSTQLAYYLQSQGVQPGQIVGISVKRSLSLYVAIFGVMKSGAIMLPLETEPGEKLNRDLLHAEPIGVVVDADTEKLFAEKQINTYPVAAPPTYTTKGLPAISLDSPAYIMYTSGTSGEKPMPKAVMCSHDGLSNLLYGLNQFETPANAKVISTALFTFDAFFYDLCVALLSAGELHLTSEKYRYSPETLKSIINTYQINYGVFLPDLFNHLDPNCPLTYIITMGSSPNQLTIEIWLKAKEGRKIYNGYGLTETTICLCLHPVNLGEKAGYLGECINQMEMHLFDPDTLTACTEGQEGEIFISGPGLAIEYYKNPGLTEEKFTTLNSVRMYKSGDYGRACVVKDKPVIEFLGRRDRQLKIHGVRIELEHLESVLRQCPGIQDITILPSADHSILNAYVIPKEKEITEEVKKTITNELKLYCETTSLRAIEKPRHIAVLSHFPMTLNGKIDYRKLAAIEFEKEEIEEEQLTELESLLRDCWQTVLNYSHASKVSITASFTTLGGDSLALIRLVNKLTETKLFTQTFELCKTDKLENIVWNTENRNKVYYVLNKDGITFSFAYAGVKHFSLAQLKSQAKITAPLNAASIPRQAATILKFFLDEGYHKLPDKLSTQFLIDLNDDKDSKISLQDGMTIKNLAEKLQPFYEEKINKYQTQPIIDDVSMQKDTQTHANLFTHTYTPQSTVEGSRLSPQFTG